MDTHLEFTYSTMRLLGKDTYITVIAETEKEAKIKAGKLNYSGDIIFLLRVEEKVTNTKN